MEKERRHIEIEQECPACNGTGLYIGYAERDGFAVQCYKCDGSGKYLFRHSYFNFTGRREKEGAKYVVKTNPGIFMGLKNGEYSPDDFGSIPYDEWKNGGEMPEMRKFCCPRWWNQTANSLSSPEWSECYTSLGDGFSGCKLFHNKAACWERWDKEKDGQ